MITVEKLCKHFGHIKAVDNISLTVQKGEVLGFLGPNGAGKSTTMRMITGFLHPDAGRIRIGEHDMAEAPIAAKELIGYLPEDAPVYGEMTVEGFLRFTAEMRGLRGTERDRAIARVVETCHLQPVRRQPIETLSKGYTHRTCFAQAIIHDPPVLVLDEPTDGLDPNQKHEIRDLIREMGREKAIILSTHILEEVDAACTRVVIIDRGKVVANGLPDELRERSQHAGAVSLGLVGRQFKDVAERLKKVEGAGKVHKLAEDKQGCRVLVEAAGAKQREGLAARLARACADTGWQLDELHTERGRLDEVFRAITHTDEGAVGGEADHDEEAGGEAA